MKFGAAGRTAQFTPEIRQLVITAAAERLGTASPLISELAGHASTRAYFRLENPQPPSRRLIAMILPPDPLTGDEVEGQEPPRELPFVNVARMLRRYGLPAPEVYHDATGEGFLLLQDLGDQTLESLLPALDEEALLLLYQRAIGLLAAWQKAADQEIKNPPREAQAFSRQFDAALLRWELEHFAEWGVEAAAGRKLSATHRAVLDDGFGRIVASLLQAPQTLCHRDFQSRNLMLLDEKLYLIDFQDALRGPFVYDLVALLRDSYVDLTAQLDVLLTEARERLPGRGLSREAWQRCFDLQTLQRKLKDAGRFVYLERVRGKADFMKFFPVSLSYARQAFNRLPDFRALREVLGEYRPELQP